MHHVSRGTASAVAHTWVRRLRMLTHRGAESDAIADVNTDRELTHINPKGRPVKQCEHCRGARKAKSHHARCDCGEKKDKDRLGQKGKLSRRSVIQFSLT